MMNARKQDHINWVKEFIRCADTGEPFTLASDENKCALGRWYNQYHTSNGMIRHQLKKIESPHRLLHGTVARLEDCRNHYTGAEFEAKKEALKRELTSAYMPQVLSILEDSKEIFRSQRRSLLIVIDTGSFSFAMSVDEVLSVEELVDVASTDEIKNLKGSPYIKEIKKSPRIDGRLIFVISDGKLAEIAREYRLETVS